MIVSGNPKPRYRCTYCDSTEIEARANGCPMQQPTCPMAFIRGSWRDLLYRYLGILRP